MSTRMALTVAYLLALVHLTLSADICKYAKKCDCLASVGEVHCPDKFTQYGLVSVQNTAEGKQEITVDCNIGATVWNIYNFPNISIPNPTKVVFNSCPFGTEGAQNLGIESSQSLFVINTITKNLTLKNSHFYKPSTLRTLWLQRNDIHELDNAVFQGFFNLDELSLRENSISDLKNCFIYTTNLEIIDLAGNSLSRLNPDVFRYNPKLTNINLGNNKITNLSERLFSTLKNLKHLDISNNDLEILPANIFHSNPELETLDISFNLFYTLPTNIFATSNNLRLLKATNCQIISLPVRTFENCTNLNLLDLSGNNFKRLQYNLFTTLASLQSFDLSNNALTKIENEFQPLINLTELNLANNGLTFVGGDAFKNNTNLKYLDLSFNALLDEAIQNRLNNCLKLEEVILANNYLENLPLGKNHTHLKYVDATSNEFKTLKFDVITPEVILDFSDNAGILECTCDAYKMFENNVTVLSDYHCTNPKWVEDTERFTKDSFTCMLDNPEDCPDNCTCVQKPFDKTVLVDCSYSNLENVPILPELVNPSYDQLEVRLEGNHLNQGPKPGMGYESATKLFLHNNLIKEFEWTPPNIKTLSLHDNQMEHIDNVILERLISEQNLNSLSLHNNPWSCTCKNFELSKFIRETSKLKNVHNITCGEGELMVNVDKYVLCQTFVLEGLLAIFIFITILVFVLKLFKGKKTRITEKKYDVFVSYSHEDEEYVSNALVPFLEQQCKLKTCVHLRDWTVGEYIPRQIVHSIVDSHYTLVVLSKGFFESMWAKMELRMAHLNDAKMILIARDCPKKEDWPKDVSCYLKNKFLIPVEDPLFWEKLENSFTTRIEEVV